MGTTSKVKGSTPSSRSRRTSAPARLEPSHDDIANRAYELYARSGFEDGHAVEHWLAAEAELRRPPVSAGC